MTVTTTMTVENKKITQYLGLVSGCVIMALPGGNKAVQRGWSAAVESATAEMVSQATQLGADAVVGVEIGAHKSGMADYMYISGTAVKLA